MGRSFSKNFFRRAEFYAAIDLSDTGKIQKWEIQKEIQRQVKQKRKQQNNKTTKKK